MGHDTAENVGQPVPHAGLLNGWILCNDSVDRLNGRAGVECGKHLVPGVGRFHCCRYGIGVAHFSNNHDIRILPEALYHPVDEGTHVRSYLAMPDDALFRCVDVLQRLSHDENVALQVHIVGVDDGIQRCALARSRNTRKQC